MIFARTKGGARFSNVNYHFNVTARVRVSKSSVRWRRRVGVCTVQHGKRRVALVRRKVKACTSV